MKKILIGIVLLIILLLLILGGIFLLAKSEIKNQISQKTKYPAESKLISQTLARIVTVDCDGVQKDPWYCNKAQFTIDAVEPYHEILYATGKGTTNNNDAFWWVAAKTRGFWGTIYFENTDKSKPVCKDIKDFPPQLFDGTVRYCIDGDTLVDRLTKQ